MGGSLGISNNGSDGDSAGAEWTVYASLDTALDTSDYLIARGSISGLAGSTGSGSIPFTGWWPSTPNTWHLIAQVSAPNDIVPGDDTTVGATVVVTGPPPANVDYIVLSVNNAAGLTAGDPLSGTFTARNTLSDTGAQPVFWTAYLSSDNALQIGTDPVIDSGSFTGLAGGATTLPAITFAGTWPSGPGTWFLIVALSSPDDINPGDNVTASGPLTTTPPDVNYMTQSVQSTAGTTAGSPLSGSFVIRNGGGHAGAQFVPWAVYLSPDATLNVGTDMLLAMGSLAAPGLASNGFTGAIPFFGTWPASTTVRTWYLIAAVGAGDDVNGTDDSSASPPVTVNPPDINYLVLAVPGVQNTGGTTGGGPITGTFTVKNGGSADGAATVSWTAYVSPNPTLDVTDQVVDTGSTTALTAGTPLPLTFGGTWPAGTAAWYLIVKVTASDDVNSTDNTLASAQVAVTGAAPVYSITSVPAPTGSTTGQAVSGTITIQNTALTSGVAAVNWQVYASPGDAVYNAGDTLLASGSILGGIPASNSNSPPWAGTWPRSGS